jgi:hypothetical protein
VIGTSTNLKCSVTFPTSSPYVSGHHLQIRCNHLLPKSLQIIVRKRLPTQLYKHAISAVNIGCSCVVVSSTGSVSCSTTVVTDKRSSNSVASHYHQLHIILTNFHRNLPFDRTVIRVCHTEVNSSICIEWLGNVYTFYCKKIIYIYTPCII